MAYFDILDTPNGRIAYQLAKYGFQLGVSSRGSGDVYEDYDGNESVDPETYTFNCFDLVLCPSVKTARLTLQESLKKNGFKESIQSTLDKASEEDKKIMLESLQKLKIDYKLNKIASNNKRIVESVAQIKEKDTDDNGANNLVNEL